ncbi:hypothetical protein ACIBI0_38710 [Microbispora rosea]|uniref:hypothetical protein n=1 Tax=Microbispora rosea TaxID=58117 RepID=UPI0037A08784
MKHLWEIDHPYYCEEGNFYKTGLANQFGSWSEFTETWFYQGDHDQNLVFRWDWVSWRRHPDPSLRSDSPDVLLLFFVLQRKPILCSARIQITDDDEPAVRAWLEERAKTVAANWAPIALPGSEKDPEEALDRLERAREEGLDDALILGWIASMDPALVVRAVEEMESRRVDRAEGS